MKVFFGQIYIEPDVAFPFSIAFQQRMSGEMTKLVEPSDHFISEYGEDWNLIFRISSKRSLPENELRGPTVFAKEKDVEYSIFLPFDEITADDDWARSALHHLMNGVISIFARLEIDSANLKIEKNRVIQEICSDSACFKPKQAEQGGDLKPNPVAS
jgi:hypothetical protein